MGSCKLFSRDACVAAMALWRRDGFRPGCGILYDTPRDKGFDCGKRSVQALYHEGRQIDTIEILETCQNVSDGVFSTNAAQCILIFDCAKTCNSTPLPKARKSDLFRTPSRFPAPCPRPFGRQTTISEPFAYQAILFSAFRGQRRSSISTKTLRS